MFNVNEFVIGQRNNYINQDLNMSYLKIISKLKQCLNVTISERFHDK